MIKFKNITAKNFLSIGNTTQGVNLDRKDLTLILGENLDLGGDDNGSRNGTGKTTLLNSISYALYGAALSNIRKDNLINRTNAKNMLVTIEFEKDGQPYKIERGRKPNVITFYVGDQAIDTKDSDSQGDSRETQGEIEKVIGMSHDMFRHVVALNTYTEPFLALKANDQRVIIEQLLGITMLSEKAEALKELNKTVKETITAEEIGIKAIADANRRFQEQIEALKRRQKLWLQKHDKDLLDLQDAYNLLTNIDIEDELVTHEQLTLWLSKNKDKEQTEKDMTSLKAQLDKEIVRANKISREIDLLKDHKCHSCGQEIHDSKHAELLAKKESDLSEIRENVLALQTEWVTLDASLVEYSSLGAKPETFYKNVKDALEHKNSLSNLQHQIATKSAEADPYAEQVEDMSNNGIVEVSYDKINDLTRIKEHQEFLLKLLTNKDSFIRKQIINQNLSYLNKRLGYYLDKIGLPHRVVFQTDLTVEITELGRELDFCNMSRGEMTRVVLALSLAFRDVWESLYHPINLLFIDELIDNGLDFSGVEASISILKKMGRDSNKSVWVVSHKDELISRVSNVLKVVKENGFSHYYSDCQTDDK